MMDSDFAPYDMDENLEDLIKSMIKSEYLDKAIDFTSMTLGQIPHPSVLSAIIYKILMKTSDKYITINTFTYLTKFLQIYPPVDSATRKYYYRALRERWCGEASLWDVVADIIKHCLYTCKVREKPIAEDEEDEEIVLNPELLLQFFVHVFQKDFENFCLSVKEKPDVPTQNQTLIAKVFWRDSSVFQKQNYELLLSWINEIYMGQMDNVKISILQHLHKLLCLMASCYFLIAKCSEAEAVHCQRLDEIAQTICRFCTKVFESHEKLKIFLLGISLRWLRIKICENLLHKIINHVWLPYGSTPPLILRKIVRQYMYPPNSKRDTLYIPNKLKPTTSLAHKKIMVHKKNPKGETPLHTACKNNKPGTLAELMRFSDDLNVKDSYGWTPLHEACWEKHYNCVYVLCRGLPHKPNADLAAASDTGETPLHFAVRKDAVNIATLLIDYGGQSLLGLKDKEGNTASYYAESDEMKQLFEKYEKSQKETFDNTENMHNVDILTRAPPRLNNFEAYSIYLLFLNCLLCDYFEMFRLKKIRKSNQSTLRDNIEKHLKKRCKYIKEPTLNEIVARFDDLLWMAQLPKIIEDFLKELEVHAALAGIDISMSLLQFQLFASAF